MKSGRLLDVLTSNIEVYACFLKPQLVTSPEYVPFKHEVILA